MQRLKQLAESYNDSCLPTSEFLNGILLHIQTGMNRDELDKLAAVLAHIEVEKVS